MSLDAGAALVTVLVGLVLAAGFARQFFARHRPYQFWWSLSFLVTALAAGMQLAAFLAGRFTPLDYRLYVIFAAAVPALMGSGSMFLLWARWAWYYTGLILLFIVLTGIGAVSGSVHPALLGRVLYASQAVTHVLPNGLVVLGFAVLGAVGAAALVLGALWSWWRRRQVYNLGIALGGIVFSLADTLAAYGITALFFLAQVVGILLLYWAVEKSREPAPAAKAQQGLAQ
jgi:MFS family permease